jgi:enoyl-CoA hydratase
MTDYGDLRHLNVKLDDGVLTLTLDRPDALNAVNEVMHHELATIFTRIAADQRVKVVVVTGRGKAFSAGGDYSWMQQQIDEPERFIAIAVEAKQIVFSLLELQKPVICKMNGHAVGLGATLALFCDFVIAAEGAKIGDPHVSVGLVAGDGGALIWPMLVGYAKAKRYLLTGDLIDAREAERIGLITEAVAVGDLDATVDKLARRLAQSASKSVEWTKLTINLPLKQVVHGAFDAGIAYEILSNNSQDHIEAVAALAAKRQPVFTGK